MRESDRLRIVVVDDHLMFAEGTARLLDREVDLEVVGIASTVAEAREVVAETVPDVAIVDFRLSDGTGATLTREILSVSPTTHVLILTGTLDENALVAAVEAGCAGFLTKDRAFRELARAVRLAGVGETFIATSLLTSLVPKFGGKRVGLGSDLTQREREILAHLRTGESTSTIAACEYLSVNTVRNHVQNILMKLNVHSKLEAVAVATREGLFDA